MISWIFSGDLNDLSSCVFHLSICRNCEKNCISHLNRHQVGWIWKFFVCFIILVKVFLTWIHIFDEFLHLICFTDVEKKGKYPQRWINLASFCKFLFCPKNFPLKLRRISGEKRGKFELLQKSRFSKCDVFNNFACSLKRSLRTLSELKIDNVHYLWKF